MKIRSSGSREEVRAKLAEALEVVPPVVERRVGEQLVRVPLLQRGPLEPEEVELRVERRGALLHACETSAPRAVSAMFVAKERWAK